MRTAGRIVLLAAIPGVPLLVALALVPRHRFGLFDGYLLVVAALALAGLLRALRRVSPRDQADLGHQAGATSQPSRLVTLATRPGDLEWLERRLRLANASAFALQAVRSAVREIAAHRLQAHHQVDLDADPGHGQAADRRRRVGAAPSRPRASGVGSGRLATAEASGGAASQGNRGAGKDVRGWRRGLPTRRAS